MRKRPLLAALTAAAALALATPARATFLRLYNVDVGWDPNGNLWHLTDKTCNMTDSPSGTVLYEFQLYQGDIKTTDPIRVGGFKSAVIQPHKCRTHRGFGVKVYTKKVPVGEYKIAVWIGDWNGSSFEGGVKYVLPSTFIRSNGP